jgi:hypothetical protein
MDRISGWERMLNGFARGGAWGALAAMFVTVVELAPLFLR